MSRPKIRLQEKLRPTKADLVFTVKGNVKGCPEEHSPEKDAKTLIEYGIYDIMFVKGSFYINPSYLPILDKVVSYMAANPNQKMAVSGHADIDGGDEVNIKRKDGKKLKAKVININLVEIQ